MEFKNTIMIMRSLLTLMFMMISSCVSVYNYHNELEISIDSENYLESFLLKAEIFDNDINISNYIMFNFDPEKPISTIQVNHENNINNEIIYNSLEEDSDISSYYRYPIIYVCKPDHKYTIEYPGKYICKCTNGAIYIGDSIEAAVENALSVDPECIFYIYVVPPAITYGVVIKVKYINREIYIGTSPMKERAKNRHLEKNNIYRIKEGIN